MIVELSKLHATGNDFLVATDELTAADAVALCDRFTGVGADGLLLLGPGSGGADATMTLFNADGSIAEMSGNGARCLAWVARRAGLGQPERLVVDTGGGRRVLDLECDGDGAVRFAVCDMGVVSFDPPAIPLDAPSASDLTVEIDGDRLSGNAAGVGNPHWVFVVQDPAAFDLARHGARLAGDPRFPNGVNVELIAVESENTLRMRVWERGVGETQSCGTGACAAAAVAHRAGLVGTRVVVKVAGGDLDVELGPTVRLGGPVHHVFDLRIDVNGLARR